MSDPAKKDFSERDICTKFITPPERNYDKKVENEDYKTLSHMRQSFVNIL
jgi:hypothetical protein